MCQRADWNAVHKKECKTFARLYPRVLPASVRALVRLLLKQPSLPTDTWDAVMALQSHSTEFGATEHWGEICLMAKGAHQYSGTLLAEPLVLSLYCAVCLLRIISSCGALMGLDTGEYAYSYHPHTRSYWYLLWPICRKCKSFLCPQFEYHIRGTDPPHPFSPHNLEGHWDYHTLRWHHISNCHATGRASIALVLYMHLYALLPGSVWCNRYLFLSPLYGYGS